MAVERTFSIVKPDAVGNNIIGKIYRRFEDAGLRIVAARMVHQSREQAGQFYAVHKQKPFYRDLLDFMTSGPVMVPVLAGENPISRNRETMGAACPAESEAGTIRADVAASCEQKGVHGSDWEVTASQEIRFWFSEEQICPRTRHP